MPSRRPFAAIAWAAALLGWGPPPVWARPVHDRRGDRLSRRGRRADPRSAGSGL